MSGAREALALTLLILLMGCGQSVRVEPPPQHNDQGMRLQDIGSPHDLDQPGDLGPRDMGRATHRDMAADLLATTDLPTTKDMDPLDDMEDPFIGAPCNANGMQGQCLELRDCGAGERSLPGFCPGPANIQCCVEDDDPVMPGECDEDAHPRPNEGMRQAPGTGGCPDGMTRIDGSFCIDVYEASLIEIMAGGAERSWSPFQNPGQARVKAVSIAGAIPQGYITGLQAGEACQEAGKRLCSDLEWMRACQGAQTTTYPYGNTRQNGVCNDARANHPAVEYFGTSADWIWSQLGNACINQLPDSLAKTGAHPGCVSEDGVFDLMGNLHEWTSTSSGIFRGGFYADTTRNGEGCLYRTTAHGQSHWDYSTGFRCCAD